MQIKVKLTNAEIKAGSVGDVIAVSPSRARRWCERSFAKLVDDRYKLEDLPTRPELDQEWIAEQSNAPKPAPAFEVGSEGGADKNPTAETAESKEDKSKSKIETETGKDGGKVDKKPSKKKAK